MLHSGLLNSEMTRSPAPNSLKATEPKGPFRFIVYLGPNEMPRYGPSGKGSQHEEPRLKLQGGARHPG